MQPMWCYAGNPVDLDDTDWRITPVDTNAKDSLNPEAFQVMEASASCYFAEVIEMLSENHVAFPAMILKSGDDLLSDTQDAVVDSGSTLTLTGSPLNCKDCEPVSTSIQLAKKGQTMKATFKCTKTYYVRDRTGTIQKLELPALIVPEIQSDLIGCKNLTKMGYRIVLDEDPYITGIYLKNPEGNYPHPNSFPFREREDLYVLETLKSADGFKMGNGYSTWHHRFSHIQNKAIRKTIKFTHGLEHLLNEKMEEVVCPDCMIGKAQRQPYPGPVKKKYKPMEQVHWDLVMPAEESTEGYRHAILLIDRATRYRWAYGLKTKDEVPSALRKWYADTAGVRTKHSLVRLMRDNAGENKSTEVTEFFESRGVETRYSAAYEQWQNGPAEASVRVTGRLIRSELSSTGLPTSTWFSTLIKVIESTNAAWTITTNSSPHFDLYGEKKDVSKMRRLGCQAFVYLEPERRPKDKRGKYDPRAIEGVYLGPATDRNTSAHKVWVPTSNKIYITNQVVFNEAVLPLKPPPAKIYPRPAVEEEILRTDSQPTWVEYSYKLIQDDQLDTGVMYEKGDRLIVKLRGVDNWYVETTKARYNADMLKKTGRSWDVTTEPPELYSSYYKTIAAMAVETPVPPRPLHNFKGLPISIDPTKPPKNYNEAMKRPDAAEWQASYDAEYAGFKEQGAFKIDRIRPGDVILGTTTRNDYKTENDKFIKRRTRLCVRGDEQVPWVQFNPEGLYAPALKAVEVRALAAIAAHHGLPIYKTDTKQAFLNGKVAERILVRPPDWWPEKLEPGEALLLCKSVYGIKQASQCWHKRVSDWMIAHDYLPINDEKTIFLKKVSDKEWIIHGLYVDDMKHIPTSPKLMQEFLTAYNRDFKTTGSAEILMDAFVGLQYKQDKRGVTIHQDVYIKDLIRDFETEFPEPLRPKKLPMRTETDLTEEEPDPSPARQKAYRSWIQRLNYPAQWSRPDISYAIGELARFSGRAGPSHWNALRHLVGYLKHRPSFRLTYKRGKPGVDPLSGFADANWKTPRSTTGTVALFNRTPIAWRSKRQPTTALSTAEAEYMAVSASATEMIYLRRLCAELLTPMRRPTPIGEDNSGCIEWTNYVIGGRDRARHIDLRVHRAHQAVQEGDIHLYKVKSEDQLADVLTKALPEPLLLRCLSQLCPGHGA